MPLKKRIQLASSTRKPLSKPSPPRPVAGAYKKQILRPTIFRKFYSRGDLPCHRKHKGGDKLNRIVWKVNVYDLDYHKLLPVLFEGLREKKQPYKTLALRGVEDFLNANKVEVMENGPEADKIITTIPFLVMPLKRALITKDPEIILVALNAIKMLVTYDLTGLVGEALVPYYRQILPTFNLFKNSYRNTGDHIDYAQASRPDIAERIQETLELLETHGGPNAFINIKYMVPTYQSAMG